ncbi:MAG TPA: saccharopine dehydrogenase NADP-binding domain-containing protein [Conexibacter sp.]|nr:saccharopine dehydrogenase NADP-binding domain-containing protein [Conexibacter sp.]
MAQRGPIVVYGATGFTGTLVAHELRRRGFEVVLAGRSAEKLARLASELVETGDVGGAGTIATRVVALDDAAGLRALLADAAAVIACAGPFVEHGEPVVRAAVATGTHYVDTTGEQPFMQLVRDRYDALARRSGAALVPAMGFDYAPGDLLAHLTAQGVEPLRELVIAYAPRGVRPTRGTLRSALGMLAAESVVYEDGGWQPARLRVARSSFPFPAPVGMQPVMPYPSGELLTIPRHVRTRRVTSLITVETFAGTPKAAPLVPLVSPAMALALRSPLRRGLEPLLARFPEGPAPESRARVRFTVVALAHGEDGRTRRGVATGGDVYALTAATTVHGAALMVADGYDRCGFLAPAEAYDAAAFLAALAAHGVAYELVDA